MWIRINYFTLDTGQYLYVIYFRVIAVGSGEGDLLAVSLELPDDCHDKQVEPLAIAPVYVHVNLDNTKRERNNINNNNNNNVA